MGPEQKPTEADIAAFEMPISLAEAVAQFTDEMIERRYGAVVEEMKADPDLSFSILTRSFNPLFGSSRLIGRKHGQIVYSIILSIS